MYEIRRPPGQNFFCSLSPSCKGMLKLVGLWTLNWETLSRTLLNCNWHILILSYPFPADMLD